MWRSSQVAVPDSENPKSHSSWHRKDQIGAAAFHLQYAFHSKDDLLESRVYTFFIMAHSYWHNTSIAVGKHTSISHDAFITQHNYLKLYGKSFQLFAENNLLYAPVILFFLQSLNISMP